MNHTPIWSSLLNVFPFISLDAIAAFCPTGDKPPQSLTLQRWAMVARVGVLMEVNRVFDEERGVFEEEGTQVSGFGFLV